MPGKAKENYGKKRPKQYIYIYIHTHTPHTHTQTDRERERLTVNISVKNYRTFNISGNILFKPQT
jgi:hypothetical protein